MELLKELILVSEKAANVARLCRQNEHLFQLLIQKKSDCEANPRFVEDFKTLADVLIQQMVKHDVGNKFPELSDSIFGEENNTFKNKLGQSIDVEIMKSQEETADLLQIVLNGDKQAAELLASEVHREVFLDSVNTKPPTQSYDVNLKNLSIWIDPIDSTAEYINGVEDNATSGICISGLKCVTVLIGAFDKISGLPVLGVVNQPFVKRSDKGWIGECFWALPKETNLSISSSLTKTICVSASESDQVITKLKTNFQIIEASGAGYKLLTVITGLSDAYVLTKSSTFKWDTCAPQAILRALGGDIVIYESAINNEIVTLNYATENKCNIGGVIAYRNEEILKEIMNCLV